MAEPALRAPKGTRDILPAEAARRRALVGEFATLAERHGFGEVVSPMFEDLQVFQRIGTATDVVIDPTNAQTLYLAIGATFGPAENGVYKTTNGGTSWTKLTNGADRIDRSLPSNSSEIFAKSASKQFRYGAENDAPAAHYVRGLRES